MIKEEDIRDLTCEGKLVDGRKKDAARLLKTAKFIEVNCPACGANGHKPVFQKDKFKFSECCGCKTVFVNPRPGKEGLKEYYTKAEAPCEFTKMVKTKEANRKELIYGARAEAVISAIKKYLPGEKDISIAEIGGGTGGFLGVLREMRPQWAYMSVEPERAATRFLKEKGFKVISDTIENMDTSKLSGADVVLNFELIEHIFDPYDFLRKVYSILPKGGLFIFTTPNYKGFDFLSIGEGYKNIGAPSHLNYFNTASIELLLKRANFDVLDVKTPGRMDVDLARKYYLESKNTGNKFLDFLLYETDEALLSEFQAFLSNNRLSGHMLAVCRKP